MIPTTVFRSMNGKDFDRPDQALFEEFNVLRKRLAQDVDSVIPFGRSPMKYEEQIKELRAHFKSFVEAGRAYIAAYQEMIEGDITPHPKAVIDELKKQPEQVA